MHIKFYPESFKGKKLFGRTGAEGKILLKCMNRNWMLKSRIIRCQASVNSVINHTKFYSISDLSDNYQLPLPLGWIVTLIQPPQPTAHVWQEVTYTSCYVK